MWTCLKIFSVFKCTDQKFVLHRVLAHSGVTGIWCLNVLHSTASKVWDRVITTLEKKEGQSLSPSLMHFFKCACCIPSCYPINPLLKWKDGRISKQVQAKLKGRGKHRPSWTPCQTLQKFCLQLHTGLVCGDRGPRCLGGGPTALCCTPALITHTLWAEAELWTPTSPSQWSVNGVTGQFSLVKLQKMNTVNQPPPPSPPNHPTKILFYIFKVGRLTQLALWTDYYQSDTKEEKIRQLGAEARGGKNRVGRGGTVTSCF